MLEFGCPRCHSDVQEEFYGPCRSCVSQLRANISREATIVAVAQYEPKMNVTPNFIATKD